MAPGSRPAAVSVTSVPLSLRVRVAVPVMSSVVRPSMELMSPLASPRRPRVAVGGVVSSMTSSTMVKVLDTTSETLPALSVARASTVCSPRPATSKVSS